jgi:predicted Zn-dependent protease
LQTTRSFRPLEPEERDSIVSTHLAMVEARSGESLERLIQRTGSSWDVREVALHNAIFIDHRFRGGETVKIARSTPYRSSASSGGPSSTSSDEEKP